MAALNNLLSNTDQTTTTAPAWYTNAQSSAAGQAGQASAQTPGLADTTGQLAVDTLNNSGNSFAQGQGSLNTIAEGAANPWLTDASGVQTPNTATPIGGLFNAQRNYLNQILPNVAAPADAQSISGGNFGSLRGLTAHNKALGDAYNQLITQQNQAALQNQATGVQAGAGLANLGQLQNQAQLNTAQYQQAAPFAASTGYSNVLKNVSPLDRVENKQVQLSPLNQAGTITDTLAGLLGVSNKTNLNTSQLAAIEKQYGIPAGTLSKAVGSGSVLGNVGSIGSWLSTKLGSLFDTTPSTEFPDYNTPADNQPVDPGDYAPPDYNVEPTNPPSDWVDVPSEWGDTDYWTTPEPEFP